MLNHRKPKTMYNVDYLPTINMQYEIFITLPLHLTIDNLKQFDVNQIF